MKYRGMKNWLKKSVAAYLATGFIAIVPGVGQATPAETQLPVLDTILSDVNAMGIDINGNNMVIPGSGINNALYWSDFSIGSEGKVTFGVAGESRNYLNLVNGNNPSEIYGTMQTASGATGGNVYLVNPNGILVGKDAIINVAGELGLSTRADINASVMSAFSGTLSSLTGAEGSRTADVINLGTVSANKLTMEGLNVSFLNDKNLTIDGKNELSAYEGETLKNPDTARNGEKVVVNATGEIHAGYKNDAPYYYYPSRGASNITNVNSSATTAYLAVSDLSALEMAHQGINWRNETDNIMLLNDVDAGDVKNLFNGEERGHSAGGSPEAGDFKSIFSGKFDGNGFTISGLKGTLFLNTNGATIENVKLKDVDITGGDNTGALVGSADGATKIQNVELVSGTLKVTDIGVKKADGVEWTENPLHWNVGGLVGMADGTTTIKNVLNTGLSIEAGEEGYGGSSGNVGGIVGQLGKSATIDGAVNQATVKGGDGTGGIVGVSAGTIKNVLNTSELVKAHNENGGGEKVGGIVGQSNGGSIDNAYNTGKVSGSIIGGIVGQANNTDISSAYNSGEIEGWNLKGGLVGELRAEEEKSASLSNSVSVVNIDNSWGNKGVVRGGAVAKMSGSVTISSVSYTTKDGANTNGEGMTEQGFSDIGTGSASIDNSTQVAAIEGLTAKVSKATNPFYDYAKIDSPKKDVAEDITIGKVTTTSTQVGDLPTGFTSTTTGAQIDGTNMFIKSSVDGSNNVISWSAFNIGKDNVVNFKDNSNYLNLVNGGNMSEIYGSMSGAGNIYLINPSGILIGEGAKIDLGGLYASTRAIGSSAWDDYVNASGGLIAGSAYAGNFVNRGHIAADKVAVHANNITFKNGDAAKVDITYWKDIWAEEQNNPDVTPSQETLKGSDIASFTGSSLSKKDGTALSAADLEMKADGYIHIGKHKALMDDRKTTGTPGADGIYSATTRPGTWYASDDNKVEYFTLMDSASVNDIQYALDQNFMLNGDIEASKLSGDGKWANGDKTFTGKLDGLGYAIKDISVSGKDGVGLFSKLDGAEIYNVNISNINASGERNVGGLAGTAVGNTKVENVTVTGNVKTTKYTSAGELFGSQAGSVVTTNIDVKGVKVDKPGSDPLVNAVLPSGMQSEDAVQDVDGNNMTITGNKANNVINWETFSIGTEDKVEFKGGDFLNIVNGGARTEIYGVLTSTGKVYILNPNGVLIGESATINVAGLGLSARAGAADIAAFKAGGNPFGNTAADAKGNILIKNDNVINAGSQIILEGNNITIKDAGKVTVSGKLVKAKGYIHYGGSADGKSAVAGWDGAEALGNLDGSKKVESLGSKDTETGYSFYKLVTASDLTTVGPEKGTQPEWKGINVMLSGDGEVGNNAWHGNGDSIGQYEAQHKRPWGEPVMVDNENMLKIKIDGLGYTASGLTPDNSSSADCGTGLFRAAEDITIENVNFTGVDVKSGAGKTGALVGRGQDIVIRNVYVEGNVTSANDGSKDTKPSVGGLIGHATGNIVIDNVGTDLKVSAENKVGGMVGLQENGSLIIKNSYVKGSVKGAEDVAGFVGTSYDNAKVSIENSFTTASITGTGDNVSAIANGKADITNVYDMTGKTLTNAEDFAGFEFSSAAAPVSGTWVMTGNGPMLVNLFKGFVVAAGATDRGEEYDGNRHVFDESKLNLQSASTNTTSYKLTAGQKNVLEKGSNIIYTGGQDGYFVIDQTKVVLKPKKVSIGNLVKDYDGTNNVNMKDVKFVGGIEGDLVQLNDGTVAVLTGSAPGEYDIMYILVPSAYLTGEDASNYAFDESSIVDGKYIGKAVIVAPENPETFMDLAAEPGAKDAVTNGESAVLSGSTDTTTGGTVMPQIVVSAGVSAIAGEAGSVEIENGKAMNIDPKQGVHDNRNGEKNGKEKKSNKNK